MDDPRYGATAGVQDTGQFDPIWWGTPRAWERYHEYMDDQRKARRLAEIEAQKRDMLRRLERATRPVPSGTWETPTAWDALVNTGKMYLNLLRGGREHVPAEGLNPVPENLRKYQTIARKIAESPWRHAFIPPWFNSGLPTAMEKTLLGQYKPGEDISSDLRWDLAVPALGAVPIGKVAGPVVRTVPRAAKAARGLLKKFGDVDWRGLLKKVGSLDWNKVADLPDAALQSALSRKTPAPSPYFNLVKEDPFSVFQRWVAQSDAVKRVADRVATAGRFIVNEGRFDLWPDYLRRLKYKEGLQAELDNLRTALETIPNLASRISRLSQLRRQRGQELLRDIHSQMLNGRGGKQAWEVLGSMPTSATWQDWLNIDLPAAFERWRASRDDRALEQIAAELGKSPVRKPNPKRFSEESAALYSSLSPLGGPDAIEKALRRVQAEQAFRRNWNRNYPMLATPELEQNLKELLAWARLKESSRLTKNRLREQFERIIREEGEDKWGSFIDKYKAEMAEASPHIQRLLDKIAAQNPMLFAKQHMIGRLLQEGKPIPKNLLPQQRPQPWISNEAKQAFHELMNELPPIVKTIPSALKRVPWYMWPAGAGAYYMSGD